MVTVYYLGHERRLGINVTKSPATFRVMISQLSTYLLAGEPP